MDLNEKLAARRRELAAEAAKIKVEKTLRLSSVQRQADLERKKRIVVEKTALDIAVQQRLKDQNIKIPTSVLESKVNAEIEALVNKAASAKLSSDEKASFIMLLVLAGLSIFVAWWLVIIVLGAAFYYLHSITEKYKKEIIGVNNLTKAVEERFGPIDKDPSKFDA